MIKFCSQIQHHFLRLATVAAVVAGPAAVMAAPPPPPVDYPEICISGMSQLINAGQAGPQDFNGTHCGDLGLVGSSFREYTIHNDGKADLTISEVYLSGANPGDFAVVANPPSTIAPGGKGKFTIMFTPTAAGYRTADVHVINNDLDEGDYAFAISGTSQDPSPTGCDLESVFVSFQSVGCKGVPLLWCGMKGRIDVYNLSHTNDLGLGVIRIYATKSGVMDGDAHLVDQKVVKKLKMQSIRKSSKPKKIKFKGVVPPNYTHLHAIVEPVDGSRDTNYYNNLAIQQYGNL